MSPAVSVVYFIAIGTRKIKSGKGMKQKNRYRVVSVFDSDAYYPSISDKGKNASIARQIDRIRDDFSVPIPNAPMAAKETLLAQLLKMGVTTNEFEGALLQSGATECAIQALRINRRSEVKQRSVKTPFNRKELIGKLLGVEIEYYPRKHGETDRTYCGCLDCSGKRIKNHALQSLVNDGSLGSHGSEIRRLTWASRNGRLQGLLGLKLNGYTDKTCGLHVHVDARHLGKDGLLSAHETYDRLCGFHPFLKRLVPKSRRNNKYCKFVNNRSGSDDYVHLPRGDRYSAINWLAFEEHETIEFRCQGGSVNQIKIESWALVCRHLVQCAAQPGFVIPKTWTQFLAILPEPIHSWCFFRDQKLNKKVSFELNERTMSAFSLT